MAIHREPHGAFPHHGPDRTSAPSAQSDRFWRRVRAREAAALVDGENYFRAFYRSAAQARRYILIAGWQFDLEARLLRGRDAERSELPVTFWSFLRALCERREQLHVYVLAWDYSLWYVLEREWWQSARAKLRSHPRMSLAFRAHPDGLGSHHQKLVVVDAEVAFVGGIDFCESRWDTRQHRARDDERRSSIGLPSKPYHDMQAALTGPVVGDLTELFAEAWSSAKGEALQLPSPARPARSHLDLASALETELHPLPSGGIVLCRTLPRTRSAPEVLEIQRMYEHLIRGAQRLIYIETQYFTSSAIGNALRERMADTARPKLAVIIVMPDQADSPKEHFVLGSRQDRILCGLRAAGARYGHELRMLSIAGRDEAGRRVGTFIHSKLMVVDDRALTFGSANLTNRSMSFDSELNLAWNLDDAEQPVPRIRELRASLLAEHTGRPAELFSDSATLIAELDRELRDPMCKLQPLRVTDAPEDDSLWTAVFDPSTELWVRHRRELKAYARNPKRGGVVNRLFWNFRLALRLAGVFRESRAEAQQTGPGTTPASSAAPAAAGASARALGLKFLLGLVALYAAVAVLGKTFAEQLEGLARGFVGAVGLPGFAIGTFLADGLHFPVPPQFYMLLAIALGWSPASSLVSIVVGSLLGGVFGFAASTRFSHVRWIERRFSRLSALSITRQMQQHPYRWVLIGSLTPIAFSWLCYLAGFYRFPRRALLLLCVLRIPKILIYFAIIRAGWSRFLD